MDEARDGRVDAMRDSVGVDSAVVNPKREMDMLPLLRSLTVRTVAEGSSAGSGTTSEASRSIESGTVGGRSSSASARSSLSSSSRSNNCSSISVRVVEATVVIVVRDEWDDLKESEEKDELARVREYTDDAGVRIVMVAVVNDVESGESDG